MRADKIRVGMVVDLAGDEYGHNSDAGYEYAKVEGVEVETERCVRIDTDQGSFGFPPGHHIRVVGQ